MRVATLLLAAALGSAGALRAQDTTTAVRPGMTEAEVRQRWGEPSAVSRINEWSYLFYANGMERHQGFLDTVFLQGGQVVDAIVRMPGRTYLGNSSSPDGREPAFTPPAAPADTPSGASVGGATVTTMPPKPER